MSNRTKLRRAIGSGGDKRIIHWCPGCKSPHAIRIAGPSPVWSFNLDYDRPTFAPSVLISIDDDEDDNGNPLPKPVRKTLCHYFINGGMIQFCGDSAHELSGQTVPLPDWPYKPGEYGGIEDE